MCVRLLHILHYFLLLQPILPPQINAEASNAAAPNMRPSRLLCCSIRAMSGPWAFQPHGRKLMRTILLHFLHYPPFLHPIFPAQKKRQGFMPWRVAPQVRLELTTLRLTAECSAIELLRNIFSILLSLMFGSGKNFRSSRSLWIPATSYSPKPFPAQYHQRLEA